MTPQQLLTDAADQIAGWRTLPDRPVSVSVAMAAGLDADAFDDPDADPGRLAAAREALRTLGRDIATRTGNQHQPALDDPDILRDGLDCWALLTADTSRSSLDMSNVAEQLRAAARGVQAS